MLASPTQLKALNPIHVLRGSQLAWLGFIRCIQNPELFSRDHFTILLAAFFVGVVLKVVLQIPVVLARASISILSTLHERPPWEQRLYTTIDFAQHWVISVPFILIRVFRYASSVPFDDLFMTSLRWVDKLRTEKHHVATGRKIVEQETPSINLDLYRPRYDSNFYNRTFKRTLIGLSIYACSHIPKIGTFVLPSVTFWTLKGTVGIVPAFAFFSIAGLTLPRHIFVVFLQTYFSTRSLTRQLLIPYFARVGEGFSHYQKAKWYREREGVLFGFSLPFFLLMRLPYIGVLMYGLAVASAAFLVSKVSHSPPRDTSELKVYAEREVPWTQGRRNLLKAGWDKVRS